MTREELIDWVFSLNPGDSVIHRNFDSGQLFELFVKKVTNSGIVRTVDGFSFKISPYFNCVSAYGRSSCGEIIPVTEELLQEVDRQRKERLSRRERLVKINDAISKMHSASHDTTSYDFAVDFLELYKKYKTED